MLPWQEGLSLRGCFNDSSVGSEVDSNFIPLLKIQTEDNPKLLKWMERSKDKFMSQDIQNEVFL